MRNFFSKQFRKLSENQKYYICSVFFLIIASIFLTWFLEYRYFINSMSRTWSFSVGSPAPFFYNSLLLFLLIGALWAFLGKPSNAATAMAIIITVVTYAHINKFNSRGFPLSPEDFQLAGEAGSLINFVSPWSIVRLVLAIAIMIALNILFNKKVAKRFHLVAPKHTRKFPNNFLIGRFLILAISVFGFMSASEFARHNAGNRYDDTFLGTHFTAWNQNRNYDDNGFIIGFLYNLQKLELNTPSEYTEEYIENITDSYVAIAEEKNISRKSPAEEEVSVVLILNESFYDPSVSFNGKSFEDYYPHDGGEIMPNIRKIMSDYPSGYMYSLDYGGGTANIEFEAITGLTNYWVNTVPYTALIPKTQKVPSVASMLKDEGYITTAIHPYNGGMYKRSISLKKEGFDKFITELEMTRTDHDDNAPYINDKSAYAEVIDQLKDNPNNQVISLITMQNHTPYNPTNYEKRYYTITADDIEEDKRREIETYYQSLHNSDKYLGEFINNLEKLDKKVAVLFFGDHSAGIFPKTNENEDKSVRDLSRLTPYFVYTNYETSYRSKHLATTTPNCLVNTMFNTLGWQKSARYYLLDDVCREEPILTSAFLEEKDLSDSETLKKYQLLTYDILGGKNYWHE